MTNVVSLDVLTEAGHEIEAPQGRFTTDWTSATVKRRRRPHEMIVEHRRSDGTIRRTYPYDGAEGESDVTPPCQDKDTPPSDQS